MLHLSRLFEPALQRRFPVTHTIRSWNRMVMTHSKGTIDISTPVHRGMTEKLDKDAFRKTVEVLAAKVPPTKVAELLRSAELKQTIVDIPRRPSVAADSDGSRLVLFRYRSEDELPAQAKQFLQEKSANLTTHKIELDYDYWTLDDILGSILPENMVQEAPSGFAQVGHVVHVNLREEYLPYKHVIGQLILDKIKGTKTVINKLNVIDNKFRVFQHELIAGEPDYLVEHSESGCIYTLDMTKVYWNTRLQTEHGRLVDLFKKEDVVADVFAGVGPFALPAAKKGCGVFANDLNPESYKFLVTNIKRNKVGSLVRASCEDGKDFIRAVVSRALDEPLPPAQRPVSTAKRAKVKRQAKKEQHNSAPSPTPQEPPRNRVTQFAMNLPDTAILFLGAFRGLLAPANLGGRDVSDIYTEMPMVHCYCFTREPEGPQAEKDIRERAERELGHPLGDEVSFHYVRDVAPKKLMYCLSFRLPRAVAFEA